MKKNLEESNTEIKSLKEYYETIVTNIPSPILIFDKDLRYISANLAFYNNFKEKPEVFIGKTIYQVLSSEILNKINVDKKILKAFNTGKIIEDIGLEFDTPTRGKRIFNIKYIPIFKWKTEEEYVMVIIDDITKQKNLEKDKKILSEKVTKLVKKIQLTDNEKHVFYGLIKYPLLNDQQLSDKIKIKRSTITAIKNKLLRQDFYSTYIIPNFALIGCELLSIIYAKFNPVTQYKLRKFSAFREASTIPEQIFMMATNTEMLSICISKNLTDFKKHSDNITRILKENDLLENINIVYFPFETSSLTNLFDYDSLISKLFDLTIKSEQKKSIKEVKRGLTEKEKLILYTLVKYHELNDTKIADRIKLSRTTINQIRHRLINDSFLRIINLPNHNKLGCNILVLDHLKFNTKTHISVMREGLELLRDTPSSTFTVSGDTEGCNINIYKDFTEYKVDSNKRIKFYKEKEFLSENPTSIIFPLPQVQFSHFNLASLVKKVLDLKVNF